MKMILKPMPTVCLGTVQSCSSSTRIPERSALVEALGEPLQIGQEWMEALAIFLSLGAKILLSNGLLLFT